MFRQVFLIAASLCALSPPALADETDAFEIFRARRGDLSAKDVAQLLPPTRTNGLSFNPLKADFYDKTAEALQLNPEEKAMFRKHGMVSIDHGQAYSFGASYYAIYARDLPVLITTDSIMHALHRSYDDILMEVESHYLAPTIADILRGAQAKLTKQDKDLDLYLVVALNLLASEPGKMTVKPRFGSNKEVQSILTKIKDLTLERPGTGGTRIYGKTRFVDYSQFRPRGHYTKSPALQRYFRTMMWLGRADTGFSLAGSKREYETALRLVALLKSTGGLVKLKEMDEVIEFMVGPSDNVTPFDLADVAKPGLSQKKVMLQLAERLKGRQRIRSQVVVSNPNDSKQAALPSTFQLFGQRFVIDSFVLSKVVFDSILYKGQKVKRMMPSGLDVMAALGSNQAVRELLPELTTHPYGANLFAARDTVDAEVPSFWEQSVYNRWLTALRTLNEPSQSKNVPEVMRTQAWAQKQLRTQLGSWAELRHDTILYAKQSYTAYPGCSYPDAYVEPYPRFFAAIEALATQAAQRLGAASYTKAAYLKDRHRAYFERLADISGRLKRIAESELAARPLSSDDMAWLKKTIDRRHGGGSGPPRYDGWYTQIFYGGGHRAAEYEPNIADVHTDPDSQRVLQTGVGNVDFLVVAIDNEDDRRVYVGPSFSYYEFTEPASNRLTDEQWRSRLGSGKVPARPAWTMDWQGATKLRHAGRPR